MMMIKQYIGQCEIPHLMIRYYMIQKDCYYGVEIVEQAGEKLITTSELFTETANDALTIAQKLHKNSVTSTTLSEIIDDYVS